MFLKTDSRRFLRADGRQVERNGDLVSVVVARRATRSSNVVGMVKSLVRMRAWVLVGALVCAIDAGAQQTPPVQQPASQQQSQPATIPDEGGPV
ncbi:MAG: hypothetical protein ABI142_08640, partial [Bryocella sp.]